MRSHVPVSCLCLMSMSISVLSLEALFVLHLSLSCVLVFTYSCSRTLSILHKLNCIYTYTHLQFQSLSKGCIARKYGRTRGSLTRLRPMWFDLRPGFSIENFGVDYYLCFIWSYVAKYRQWPYSCTNTRGRQVGLSKPEADRAASPTQSNPENNGVASQATLKPEAKGTASPT